MNMEYLKNSASFTLLENVPWFDISSTLFCTFEYEECHGKNLASFTLKVTPTLPQHISNQIRLLLI
jgi:hypothetical protein